MTLVPFSIKMQKVWNSFKSAGVTVKVVNPSTVQTFLREKPLNDPTKTDKDLPLPITATLIRDETRCSKLLSFCLKEFETGLKKVTKDSTSLLNGLPLLLTRDKVLRVFDSNTPKLISAYESLFLGCEDQFVDYETNQVHTRVLQTFNLVKGLTVPYAVKYLKHAVERHLEICEVDPQSGLHLQNERALKWFRLLWKFLTSYINPAISSDGVQSLTLSDVRQLFHDSCILPVVCPRLNNKHFLTTMKEMPNVIHFPSERDISGILFKLGFMKLDIVFFSEIHVDRHHVHSLLHPELMDVNDKSSVLDQVYKIKHAEFSQLSTGEMKRLQCFLQDGVSKTKDKQDYQRKLKSLPLFKTIHGNGVRIDGPKEVFILDTTFSMSYSDLFSLPNSNSIFLQYNLENCTLSQMLKIEILTDLEYFMTFILPIVHRLTESQLLQCLKLLLSLQCNLNYCKYKDKIISSLKTVKLIRSSQGRLETASYYFDESVELYKKILPKERFCATDILD
ncbi:sacsin-like [Sparus aurata]|uniref:sacsin-like n=1 Tax=Sparus aurata TaxID=8175 RepID=UPI0011C0D6AC|nr:sacsin-like [Sparus aurata]